MWNDDTIGNFPGGYLVNCIFYYRSLELESIISQHPAVNEVAVIGIKDDKWGERPLAMIVLRAEQTASVEEIKAHVLRFAEEGTFPNSPCRNRCVSSTAWPAPASASSTRRPCASNWPVNAFHRRKL